MRHLTIFTALVTTVILALLYFAGGYVDYFYVKFTTPRQHSMVLGDSRSFQGIRPEFFNNADASSFEGALYNYSFTLGQTAYGDRYLASILRKLDPDTRNGLFVLNVHPWLLAEREEDDFARGIYFETDLPPHNMQFPNTNPNLEYFFRNYSFFHFKAVFRRVTKTHDDGWLEENVAPETDAGRAALLEATRAQYEEFARTWRPAAYRLSKLGETVRVLGKHGKVVLLRMPVDASLREVERGFWPDFDAQMDSLAAQNDIRYLNYAAHPSFTTLDGIHLDSRNAALFSQALRDTILKPETK